jgi:hypothetical protein
MYPIIGANLRVAECNSDGSHHLRYGWGIATNCTEAYWNIHRVCCWTLKKKTPLILTIAIRTLHKIHTFVEAQQNGNKLKKFFRQGEMSTLLKDCKARLQQGFEIFQVWHLFGNSTTH